MQLNEPDENVLRGVKIKKVTPVSVKILPTYAKWNECNKYKCQ